MPDESSGLTVAKAAVVAMDAVVRILPGQRLTKQAAY